MDNKKIRQYAVKKIHQDNQIKLLESILEQQVRIGDALESIADTLMYFAQENHADHRATEQIRFLGDGLD